MKVSRILERRQLKREINKKERLVMEWMERK